MVNLSYHKSIKYCQYIKAVIFCIIFTFIPYEGTAKVTRSTPSKPIVIAHRGASGYLPEHTLEAKALAYAMKPDYIEQDIVMTKDDHLVILHDRYLDRVSNVAEKFPKRARQDGRYYAIDFTLAEIKTLNLSEGFKIDKDGKKVISLPQRFPLNKSSFQIATLEEEIELIQGLNQTLKYNIGLYPEIKAPWFHQHEGKDISLAVLKVLKKYGYRKKTDKIYLQCFDANELRRIYTQLMPHLEMDLKLIQLIAYTSWQETMELKNKKLHIYNYDWMFKPGAMRKISEYAVGIGPWMSMLIDRSSTAQKIIISPLLHEAKQAGLQIHPYTFRTDPSRIPKYVRDFEHLLSIFYHQLEVDGFFTDYPDLVVNFISRQ